MRPSATANPGRVACARAAAAALPSPSRSTAGESTSPVAAAAPVTITVAARGAQNAAARRAAAGPRPETTTAMVDPPAAHVQADTAAPAGTLRVRNPRADSPARTTPASAASPQATSPASQVSRAGAAAGEGMAVDCGARPPSRRSKPPRPAAFRHSRHPPSGTSPAHKETAMALLAAGTPAPDFEALRPDMTTIRLSDLRGRYVLVYFYPKDMTPGCTTEACSLNDHLDELQQSGAEVIGVSF